MEIGGFPVCMAFDPAGAKKDEGPGRDGVQIHIRKTGFVRVSHIRQHPRAAEGLQRDVAAFIDIQVRAHMTQCYVGIVLLPGPDQGRMIRGDDGGQIEKHGASCCGNVRL